MQRKQKKSSKTNLQVPNESLDGVKVILPFETLAVLWQIIYLLVFILQWGLLAITPTRAYSWVSGIMAATDKRRLFFGYAIMPLYTSSQFQQAT